MDGMCYLISEARAAQFLGSFSLDLEDLVRSGRLTAIVNRRRRLYHVEDLIALTWTLGADGQVAPECKPAAGAKKAEVAA